MTATGPDLLSAVCQHLSSSDRKSLHSVNRAMRTAMNVIVTSIRGGNLTLPNHQQLHVVFPNVSLMALCVRLDGWRVYLEQLASSSELLLNKLRHLSLSLAPANMTIVDEMQAVLELLTRCTSLVSLEVVINTQTLKPFSRAAMSMTFTGRGTNPQAQALSLQQQLAAFQASPTTFLAPTSWPHHACLTHFHHSPDSDSSAYAAHVQHALRTPSLSHLSLLRSPLLPSTASHITTLTTLTHLEFSTHAPNPTDPLLASLPSLPHLRHLHIHTLLLEDDDDDDIDDNHDYHYYHDYHDVREPIQVTIPPTWRHHLTLLTALHLSGGPKYTTRKVSVCLPQLCILPSLQTLRIEVASTGSLTSAVYPEWEAGAPLNSTPSFPSPPSHPATCPTAGPSSHACGQQQQGASRGGLPPPPPPTVMSHLQELALLGPTRWPPLDTMLPRLPALRVLALHGFSMTPNLCRALASLPNLTHLTLATCRDEPGHSRAPVPPEASRPLFRRLQFLAVSTESPPRCPHTPPCLQVLATTTRIPPACRLHITGYVGWVWVEAQQSSSSWVDAAMRGVGLRAGFSLHSDADVEALADALAPVTEMPAEIHVHFGAGLSPGAMRRLGQPKVNAAGLEVVVDWRGKAAYQASAWAWWQDSLTTEHVRALVPLVPSLTTLVLGNCRLDGGDEDVAAVAEAGGGLEELELRVVEGVTDVGLLAITRGCRNLKKLRLTVNSEGVTLVGVQGVLFTMGALQTLEITGGEDLAREVMGWARSRGGRLRLRGMWRADRWHSSLLFNRLGVE